MTKRKLKITTDINGLVGMICRLVYITQTNKQTAPDGVLPEKGFHFMVLVVLCEENFQSYSFIKKFSEKSLYNYQKRLGDYVDIVGPKKKVVEAKKKVKSE